MIIDHNDSKYRERWESSRDNRFNGAYYYSKEIVKNIIPLIKTDRHWVLINTYGDAFDHSIVFIHNNKHPENYNWLERYNDLILVCGVPETCGKVKHLGKAIYLPLSVDVKDVEQYKSEKTEDCAFAGRIVKTKDTRLPDFCHILGGLPREQLLPEIAKYKRICAVGRTAIEARILGCEIVPYDPRFPDPSIWKVLDNKDAARILQEELDEIDGG